MVGWNFLFDKRFGRNKLRPFSKRLYLGEAENFAVRVTKVKKLCRGCGCTVPKGEVYADYWLAGRSHHHYCLAHWNNHQRGRAIRVKLDEQNSELNWLMVLG